MAQNSLQASPETGCGWLFRSPISVTKSINVHALIGYTKATETSAMFAPTRILDALDQATGTMLVEIDVRPTASGQESPELKVKRFFDAAECLHEFALQLAGSALDESRDVAPPVLDLLRAKRAWLQGELDDDALAQARSTAAVTGTARRAELAVLCAGSPSALNSARLTMRLLDSGPRSHQRMADLLDHIVENHCRMQ